MTYDENGADATAPRTVTAAQLLTRGTVADPTWDGHGAAAIAAYVGTPQTDPTAPPTYTRDVDGTAVTFDYYGNGADRHYDYVGHYARVESPDATIPLPDGGWRGAVTYRPHGTPTNWTAAMPDAMPGAELDRGAVKRGRSKKGATALVVRHGRARRDVATRTDDGWSVERVGEAQLVRQTRDYVLGACEACAAVTAQCENSERHGAATYCADCANGCGCLAPLVGIETISWESIVAGGLATDTRWHSLTLRQARAATALERATARQERAVERRRSASGADAVKRADAALQRAVAALDRATARVARLAAQRRAMDDATYGLAARSDCAVAHDSLDGAVAAIVNGAANGAAWREDHGPNGTAPPAARRVTGWPTRTALRVPRWRKSETDDVRTVAHAAIPTSENVTATSAVTVKRERVWQIGTATVTALLAPRDNGTYWRGHNVIVRTATAREREAQAQAAATARRTLDESQSIPIGATVTLDATAGTLRVTRTERRYRLTYPDGARRDARTWGAVMRLATAAGATV